VGYDKQSDRSSTVDRDGDDYVGGSCVVFDCFLGIIYVERGGLCDESDKYMGANICVPEVT